MTIDKNEFFREATLRICGNLKFEDALVSTLKFLREVMPVDKIFLQFFNSGFKAFHTLAIVTVEKGIAVDLLVPLSSEALHELGQFEKEFRSQKKNVAFMQNDNPYDLIANRDYFSFHKTDITSIIVVPLGLGLKMLGQGSLFFVTLGSEKFTQEHADLLSLLKEPFAVAMSNALQHREVIKLKDLLVDDNRFLQTELKNKSGENIIGSNFGLKGVMEMVRQVANLDSPVILLGETGTGKDLIANTIHYSSSRRDGPFISVNCGAIPESLIDSELFGHEKGAFTGALSQKRGRFERAHKGTIFLDEVGELPPQAQVRLLRVLQNKEIERVGGTKTIELDIRVIAATNRDLEEMVRENKFREDLWFRLNVFPITLPPLRERKSDIPALLQHFILQKAKDLKLPFVPEPEPSSIDILMNYSWPGNVREMDNVVERALILSRGGPISFKHLELSGKMQNLAIINDNIDEENLLTLDEMTSRHIEKVLMKTNGKIHGPGGAADILGINASTLRNRMNKLGIKYGRV